MEEAVELFTQAITAYPECRHAHAGLGAAIWQRYQSTQAEDDLRSAIEEFAQAAEIGMQYGRIRYTDRIAEGLAKLGEARRIDEFFSRALQVGDRTYLTRLHYAQALAWLDDSRAEEWYQKAIEIQPAGNFDAQAYYAEWLLDHEREKDVLKLIDAQDTAYYLRFLRGVALERLGHVDEAALDYAYAADFSRDFPVPPRYRLAGSEAQRGIVFEGERKGKVKGLQSPLLSVSESQVRRGLAYLIYGEAGGESRGGQRAVGWTVRTRVFRGGAPVNYCVGSPGSGTLAEKYKNVICSGEFDGACDAWCADPDATCSSSWSANVAGYNVFWGIAPEPIGNWCPSGEEPWGPACWSNVRCEYSNKYGANADGPIAFHGLSQCPSSPAPFNCATCQGFVCGDGYPDNCFYNHP